MPINAAKLVVDALLQRFLPLARRRIESTQAQVRIILVLFLPDHVLFSSFVYFIVILCS